MFAAGMNALAPAGTLVTIAILGAEPPAGDAPIGEVRVDTLKLFFNSWTLTGTRGSRRRDQQLAMSLLGAGRIAPLIDKVFPLSEMAEAHRYYECGEHVGRIAISV